MIATNSEIRIRNFRDADLAECGALFHTIFGPQGCGEDWTQDTSLKHITENAFKKEFCFVAETENTIVGLVLAFPITREAGTDIFIDTIGVLSAHQGQGIGKSLWQKVSGTAQKHGFKSIRLLGNKRFLSYDWYKKMGMAETGWIELGMKLD